MKDFVWITLPCGKHKTALYDFLLHGADKVYCPGCDALFPRYRNGDRHSCEVAREAETPKPQADSPTWVTVE